jgi:membrane-associated phospholipid phosphatase
VIARRLAYASLTALALAVMVFWFATRTVAGQEFGDDAYEARFIADPSVRDAARDFLGLLTHGSLLVVGASLVIIALLRRRPRLGVGLGVLVFGTAFVAEVLKEIIPRAELGVDPFELAHNTGPSGHASISTAIALAAVMVVPVRWRIPVGAVGGVLVAIMATSTLAAGWHRPGDALAGELMATAIALGIAAVLVVVRGAGNMVAVRSMVRSWVYAVLALPVLIVVIDIALLPEAATADTGHADFVVGAVLIALLALACVAAVVALLRDVDLDPLPRGLTSADDPWPGTLTDPEPDAGAG